jgi:hypothetical protein
VRLIVKQSEYDRIAGYLFRDGSEGMALALCGGSAPGRREYRIREIFFPADRDFSERNASRVTLKAESAYPLLKKLARIEKPAFLQIHSHGVKDGLFFSVTDDANNAFNARDIREFHPSCRFFRIVFARGGDGAPAFLAQRHVAPFCFFAHLKVVIE